MSFLFGGGGGPSDEDRKRQRQREERADQQVAQQEERTKKAEQKERKDINQRLTKKKTGGMNLLLSEFRDNQKALGNPITETRTLGPDRNPRR